MVLGKLARIGQADSGQLIGGQPQDALAEVDPPLQLALQGEPAAVEQGRRRLRRDLRVQGKAI